MLNTPGLDTIFRPFHRTNSRNLTEGFRTRCNMSRSQEHVHFVSLYPCRSVCLRFRISMHLRLTVWIFNIIFLKNIGSIVGWGTMLQAGRSWLRFPMKSLDFLIDLILPTALWPWGRLSLYQKWIPGILLGGEGWLAFKAEYLTAIFEPIVHKNVRASMPHNPIFIPPLSGWVSI
jgi:hypothetical protein